MYNPRCKHHFYKSFKNAFYVFLFFMFIIVVFLLLLKSTYKMNTMHIFLWRFSFLFSDV